MQDNLRLEPLREHLLNPATSLPNLQKQIGEFSCARDKDVETFLHTKAIEFELSGISRTYLYFLHSTGKETSIAAFFSLAITSVDFSGVTKSRRQKVLGRTPGKLVQDDFGGLLIAQLARCDDYDSSVVDGKEILDNSLEVIADGRDILGGRAVYLDCKEPLVRYYEQYGFKALKTEPYDANGLYTMFMNLPKIVLR
jgi:hypothetical protein